MPFATDGSGAPQRNKRYANTLLPTVWAHLTTDLWLGVPFCVF